MDVSARSLSRMVFSVSKLYEDVEKKIARTTFKTGYIYQRIILRPVDEVKVLRNDLKVSVSN